MNTTSERAADCRRKWLHRKSSEASFFSPVGSSRGHAGNGINNHSFTSAIPTAPTSWPPAWPRRVFRQRFPWEDGWFRRLVPLEIVPFASVRLFDGKLVQQLMKFGSQYGFGNQFGFIIGNDRWGGLSGHGIFYNFGILPFTK